MTRASSPSAGLEPDRLARLLERIEGIPAPICAALGGAGVAMAYLLREERLLIFGGVARAMLGVGEVVAIERAVRSVERRVRRSMVRFFDARWMPDGEPGGDIVLPLALPGRPRMVVELSLCADSAGGGHFIVIRDITAVSDEIDLLREERDHLRHTVELNPQLPWLADAHGRVIAFTERFETLTGRSQDELIDSGWELVIHPEDYGFVRERLAQAVRSGTQLDMRYRLLTASGVYRWMRAMSFPLRDADGKVVRFFGYTEDIDDHVLIEQQIRWTAEHDPLTRLPNRMVFNRHLERVLREDERIEHKVAILLADVDNFKDVNDILGHDAGDAMLAAFADLIGRALPQKAVLSRIGGDEFAIVYPFDGPLTELRALSNIISDALREPIAVDGRSVECRVSIGASVFPYHGLSPTELFKNADIALYRAKAQGGGQMTMFSVEMKQETQRRVAMINLGRKAVETDAIIPYYQMQVALPEGRPAGFEALLRRRDRQGRICAPASIAAAFEDAGVAEAIGDTMLKAVLADIRTAKERGTPLGNVSVNFATAEFRNANFVERLTNRIADAGVEFADIMIEVTESVFLGRQIDTVSETIRTLARLGFRIALDDFGTGYASLVHLRQLPVDTLKIDQSFVRALTASPGDLAIVSAIINLGASLHLNVIAEGIETEGQLKALRELGLRFGQGYLFARPVPFDEACRLVADADQPETRTGSI